MEAVPDVGSTTGSTKIDIPKIQKGNAWSGVRTHADKRPADLKSAPLDRSGIQAVHLAATGQIMSYPKGK